MELRLIEELHFIWRFYTLTICNIKYNTICTTRIIVKDKNPAKPTSAFEINRLFEIGRSHRLST